MAQVAAPANDRKRVKVYELRNNDWFDRGTGFCQGVVVNQEEARILVTSEDEPIRKLLETRISKDDGYQKQQETLIVWTEQNGTDMALSFQEPEGCAVIWNFVNECQSRLQALHQEDGLSDDIAESVEPIMLPSPDLGNLAEIENRMRAANGTQAGREALAKFVINDKYIPKLIPLVEMAEDLESLSDLHRLCSIMKILILLNDNTIIEYAVTDEVLLGVVGALEYDPDFPLHKANHRQYLSDESKFKEVVRIRDENVKRKIHHTYRLQYLKDVVLARILDDPTFSILNSLIYFNQLEIVNYMLQDSAYLEELFGVIRSRDQSEQRKRDAVLMIQQCCATGKSLQQTQRAQLYMKFVEKGVLDVIPFALKHHDASVRVAGADILIGLLDHDSNMVRIHNFKALRDKGKPLTDTLIELFLVEVDLGVKAHIAEALKALLDPTAVDLSAATARLGGASDPLGKLRSSLPAFDTDTFIQEFYEQSVLKLFQPFKDLEGKEIVDDLSVSEEYLYFHLVDLLCHFIRQHQFRSKYLIVSHGISMKVARLLNCRSKYLQLTALKYFRACLGLHDEYLNRQMIAHNLLEPILQLVIDTMPRDNALNSACLEYFETVRREIVRDFIVHLVTTCREKLESITYVDVFQGLIRRYEQMQEPATTQELDNSFTSVDSEGLARPVGVVNGGKWGQGLKELDAVEEAYFNGSDDEEEGLSNGAKTNGASPVRPLVNYPDDDDGDENEMDVLTTSTPSASPTASQAQDSPNRRSSSKSDPTTPPERISEKRRREEDEEDELLANLSSGGPKRRSSVPSIANLKLRRKSSMTSAKDSAPKKISISLPMKSGGEDSKDG